MALSEYQVEPPKYFFVMDIMDIKMGNEVGKETRLSEVGKMWEGELKMERKGNKKKIPENILVCFCTCIFYFLFSLK